MFKLMGQHIKAVADDVNWGVKNKIKKLDAIDISQKNIHDWEDLDMETK